MTAERERLPNRRPVILDEVFVNGTALTIAGGLDPATGRIREIFLSGGKSGSALDLLTQDAAVVISVALQNGISADALAHSIARAPLEPTRPEDFSRDTPQTVPASPIGAALDWIIETERTIGELTRAEATKGATNAR